MKQPEEFTDEELELAGYVAFIFFHHGSRVMYTNNYARYLELRTKFVGKETSSPVYIQNYARKLEKLMRDP